MNFRKLFGGAMLFVGAALVTYGIIQDIYIQYVDHPDATQRFLWIGYTWRMLSITASLLVGVLLALVGWEVLESK